MNSLPSTSEGHTSTKQQNQMSELIAHYIPEAEYIMEIGFNGGHSAEGFLKINEKVKVVSFDIGEHSYVHTAKKYMDEHYPDRHSLVLGNSTETIPLYKDREKFDVILIDGGHFYGVAKADLMNCKKLAHKKTLVFMDDVVRNPKWVKSYTQGPTQAWQEALESGAIRELGAVEYSIGRGMVWGLYSNI
jgi:predicted O-methyltransferase YrrM